MASFFRTFSFFVSNATRNFFKSSKHVNSRNFIVWSLSAVSIDQKLRKQEVTQRVDSSTVESYHVAQLASNAMIEDRYAVWKGQNGEKIMFLVADGHGGSECSDFLAKTLCQFVEKKVDEATSSGITVSMESVLKECFLEFDKQVLVVFRFKKNYF